MVKLDQCLTLFGSLIPVNFFGILSGPNQVSNFVLLWEIDDFFGDSINGIEKDTLANHVDSFISSNKTIKIAGNDPEHPDQVASPSRAKASSFVKDLIDRGWLEEEQSGFKSFERRSDGFVNVFGALKNLVVGQDTQEEYSTSLLSIYNAVCLHETQNFVEIIEGIKKDREDLVKELKSIDSKVKRFIQKALNGKEKNDKELLDTLLDKYQSEPYVRALLHLNLQENPAKFRHDIISGLERFETFDLEDIVTAFVMAKRGNLEGDAYVKARNEYRVIVLDILHATEETVDGLSSQVESIMKRNASYVTSTRQILTFRLNHGENINGMIDSTLRKIKAKDSRSSFDYTPFFPVPFFHQIDVDSIYKSRKMAAKAPKEVTRTKREINPLLLEEAKRLAEYQSKFTREAVESFVLVSLDGKESIRASEIKVTNDDDALRLLMVPVFGSQIDSLYSVSRPDETRFNGYLFNMNDFLITLKEEKQ